MLSCGENPLTYLLSQPAADGLIEKAKSRIGNGDGKDENAHAHENMVADRSVYMGVCPFHLDVDERVVGDVERIGNSAKEIAHGGTLPIGTLAARPDHHYKGENHEHAEGIVDAVEA